MKIKRRWVKLSAKEKGLIANKAGLPVDMMCCEKAKRRSCVCRVSRDCSVHGVRCEGSHD